MSVASRVESHEAEVWARCIELAALAPGNPLGAVVDRDGAVPLPSLTSIDSSEFNRVVSLGMDGPATAEDIQRIAHFYLDLNQADFRVEIAPDAAPADIAELLSHIGLHPAAETVTKLWRCFDAADAKELSATAAGIDVRQLSSMDAEQVSNLNVRAWGAWQAPVSLSPWFAASVGDEGFTHYGAFVEDRLVCTGAMAVSGELAWIGFDATHPRYQSQQLRRTLTSRRIVDALTMGCWVVHAEADSTRLTARARLLDSHYRRRFFVSRRGTVPA